MALVYLAEDLKNHRQVAIKVLRPELAASLGPQRFLREIQTAARLVHPGILPLHDSGEAAGQLYYVMPFVEGESLRDRLVREHQLPLEDALRITREVADALSYAHSLGVVHRDIKPDNILFQAGHAIVSDFGIARAVTAAGGETLTDTGLAVGTPAYMSPEQASAARDVDARSDVYSLACVLYEMLAGEPPFTGPTAQAIVAKKLSGKPPRVSVVQDSVPLAVEAALATALARTPADRFPTALQFATAAAAWLLRPNRSAATLDPKLIAVMPFRATGATPSLQQLAERIPDIFWTKITGEFGPRVTDPATVGAAWHGAGGTPEAGLPEEKELRVAREQGAGLLVRGVIGGSATRVTITASMLAVSGHTVRVPPTTVEGPVDRWIPLLDSLVVLLLVKDFRVETDRIRELSRYSPEAIQAYLSGLATQNQGDFGQAQRLLAQALQADSTFAQAAFSKWDAGETDTVAARYAWEHQDELNVRDRARLRAQVGWRFGATHSEAEVIVQWDSITQRWPEYKEGWYELAEELEFAGGLVGEPDWLERSRSIWKRLIPQEGIPSRLALKNAAGAAALDGDIRAMRIYLDRWAALPPTRSNLLAQFQWRHATLAGDSAAAQRAFPAAGTQRLEAPDAWRAIPSFVMADGRGTADGDRAARLIESWQTKMVWARTRGRHEEWLQWRDGRESPLHEGMTGTVMRLRDALFLGEPEESAVAAAARYMKRAAEGTASSATPAERAIARCWSTLWRIGHGDTTGAHKTARYLNDEVQLPYHLPVCAGLIEVLLTRAEGGDLHSAVRHWDGIVHSAPVPVLDFAAKPDAITRDGTLGLENVLSARLLLQVGDTNAALAAARRRFYDGLNRLLPGSMLVDALREEGRLAAMTGDTAGAVRAYNHYLALRENPDYEPWRQERDQVRRELAALISEPKR
jgi:Protein kinase domain